MPAVREKPSLLELFRARSVIYPKVYYARSLYLRIIAFIYYKICAD